MSRSTQPEPPGLFRLAPGGGHASGAARGPGGRSVAEVLAPLDRLSTHSPNLLVNRSARFASSGRTYELPRYLLIGPRGGDDPIRIGLFAGVHGDEPEGVHAVVQFLCLLDQQPELARGYCLFAYPVCNPTGFEDRTRFTRSGKDLNRQFWAEESTEPEVKLLQSELTVHSFHGIISLHTDDTSHGFYGYAHGATITRDLVEPALEVVERCLPVNHLETIDGFPARNGIIHASYEGVLRAPPGVRPRPFEIILETPADAPTALKEAAFVAALQTILTRYREFIAYAPNL